MVSTLVTIHLKTGIGRLSAYCGAVSAGVGAGAGIAWLHGGRFREVAHTIVNALAMVSGIICDGAKPSCAAKIAVSVEAGLLGFYMFQKGRQFYAETASLQKGLKTPLPTSADSAEQGMRETDRGNQSHHDGRIGSGRSERSSFDRYPLIQADPEKPVYSILVTPPLQRF
ncbi:MAG: L-serine ammonia-lyase, iron-sulfur-dependent, subunit alpha [Desulfotignum sp.]|nr:L-serine ammonia-lyase, iron-sulfur-dependent, subunit alpha [Desulfotignum sp.]